MQTMFSSDSPDVYASMLEKLEEIEHALDRHDSALITQFSQDLDSLLKKIQIMNGQQTSLPNNANRQIVEEIFRKNTAITARLQDIMALQRIELAQIKQGRETAKGYASHRSMRTGSIINSTN